ncbi:MAG: hypothetical protein LBD34_00235 [Puniceicoccales bacterium]|nr:hypothetical protein [Puniceicoccales bacterium]
MKVGGKNLVTQGIQSDQKKKRRQFENKNLHLVPKIQTQSGSKIPTRGSSISKILKESHTAKPASHLPGSLFGSILNCLRMLLKYFNIVLSQPFIIKVLQGGINKAFFGKTDGINSKSWAEARTRLTNMTLGKARGIWQTIANEIAMDCFDATGNVNVKRIQVWMAFLGNAGNFKKEPFCRIPHAELMRSQMHRV